MMDLKKLKFKTSLIMWLIFHKFGKLKIKNKRVSNAAKFLLKTWKFPAGANIDVQLLQTEDNFWVSKQEKRDVMEWILDFWNT